MFFLASILVDTAILGMLLLIVAKVDFLSDFMSPLSVIVLMAITNIVTSLLFRGSFWGVPQLVVMIAALYFLLGWLFNLPIKERRIIVGIFFGLKFAFAILTTLLF